MNVIVKKSSKSDKKYDAIIDGKKKISFGAAGYSDYTIHKDDDRKHRYIKRHKNNENWNNPKTAGFYAKNLLWNKNTLRKSIDDINKRFKNLTVKMDGKMT